MCCLLREDRQDPVTLARRTDRKKKKTREEPYTTVNYFLGDVYKQYTTVNLQNYFIGDTYKHYTTVNNRGTMINIQNAQHVQVSNNNIMLVEDKQKIAKIGFQDRLSPNAGQKYCRMLQESIMQYF